MNTSLLLLLSGLVALHAAPAPGLPKLPPVPVGTESNAVSTGGVRSVGNARVTASGGGKAEQLATNQQSGADAVVRLTSQLTGQGQASAASTSGTKVKCVPPIGGKGASQAATKTSGAGVGQVTTESDANGRAQTVCESGKTDVETGTSTGTRGDGKAEGESKTKAQTETVNTPSGSSTQTKTGSDTSGQSAGSGGTQGAGRARAKGLGNGVTANAGSQTKTTTTGDGKAKATQEGQASGTRARGKGAIGAETQASAVGQSSTVGGGSGSAGESSTGATANQGANVAAESKANEAVKTTRTGVAGAGVNTKAGSTLRKDGNEVVGDSNAGSSLDQQSQGSGNTRTNGASTAGHSTGSGTGVADSRVGAVTAGTGAAQAEQSGRAQTRVKLPSAWPCSLPSEAPKGWVFKAGAYWPCTIPGKPGKGYKPRPVQTLWGI